MNRQFVYMFLAIFLAPVVATASSVTLPHTFQSNKTAKASEVNANFSTAVTGINDNDSRVTALEAAVNALQTTVAGLQTDNTALKARLDALEAINTENRLDTLETADLDNRVTALENAGGGSASLENRVTALEDAEVQKLNAYLEIHETQPSDTRILAPIVRVTGANLQVTNGTGTQSAINGLGNLQVGYGKTNFSHNACSSGYYQNQVDCENAGETWDGFHVGGSHNLIGGSSNYFSQTGGLVFGSSNVINRPNAIALGGFHNQSAADNGVVVAGNNNDAIGSQIDAGSGNILTKGKYVVLIGGTSNKVASSNSVLVGGFLNDIQSTSNGRNVIVGGRNNVIKGEEDRDSVLVGGNANVMNVTDVDNPTFANGNVLVGGDSNQITSGGGNEPNQSVVVGGVSNNMKHDQSVITGTESTTSTGNKLVEP